MKTRKSNFPMILVTVLMAIVFSFPVLAGNPCHVKNMNCNCLNHIPNLTDAQKAKIQQMQIDFQKKRISQKAELDKQALDLKAMIMQGKSEKEIWSKIDEIHKIKAQLQKDCYSNHLAIRNLLTDEQKKAMPLMMCNAGGCSQHHAKGCCKKGGVMNHNCCKFNGPNKQAPSPCTPECSATCSSKTSCPKAAECHKKK